MIIHILVTYAFVQSNLYNSYQHVQTCIADLKNYADNIHYEIDWERVDYKFDNTLEPFQQVKQYDGIFERCMDEIVIAETWNSEVKLDNSKIQ